MKKIIVFLFLTTMLLAQKDKGTIYLTFDDGPINATIELLDILKKEEVKATFFINGFHLYGEGDENEDKAKEALEKLFKDGHIVGNHSYDHMLHNCTDGKRSGAAYCNEVGKWPIRAYGDPLIEIGSFRENIEKVNTQIPVAPAYSNNYMRSLARLPYTNSWRVTKDFYGNALCATTDSLAPWDEQYVCDPDNPSQSVKNSILLADMLTLAGFQAYGWDIDWGPTDWGAKYPAESMIDGKELLEKVDAIIKEGSSNSKEGGSNQSHTLDHTSPLKKGKVIVLAHDFLFEDGKRGKGAAINLPKLKTFIVEARKKGYTFETLNTYAPQK